MSVGYKRGDIVFAEMLEDPLEWEESMDEEEYKIITQTELEKDEYKEFLDSIGMYYLGE